ncbi:MAG: AAA family ATPase [Actinomycetota bacterium]
MRTELVDSARITLVATPGPLIGALAGMTSTIVNPADLPTDDQRRAEVLAETGADVAVLGDDLALERALALASHLSRSCPEIEMVLLAPGEATTLAAAMAAGIRLVVDPSTPTEKLREEIARVGAGACLRRSRIGRSAVADHSEEPQAAGRIITVMAAKGGVGKTTIAVNLAVELARHHPQKTVLVDLDLMAGDADLLLDLEPAATLASLAIDGGELDSGAVKLALSSHSSGLLVLPAPETLVEADAIDPQLVRRVLELLRQSFAFVIVDTAPGAGGVFAEAAELADDLLAVASPDLGGLRSLRRNLDALDTLELVAADRHLILNRSDHRTGLGPEAVEGSVELPIAHAIPDAREIPTAANQGIPFVANGARSEAGLALRKLAARLDPTGTVEVPPERPNLGARRSTDRSHPAPRRPVRSFDAR